MTKEKRERRPRKTKSIEAETPAVQDSEAIALHTSEPEVVHTEPESPVLESSASTDSVSTEDVISETHDLNAEAPEQEKKPERVYYNFDNIVSVTGVMELMPDGYGFLRSPDYNYLSSPDDVYVSQAQIKQYGLKPGDVVTCGVRPPREGEKYFPLIKIEQINGRDPSVVRDRVIFDYLTPLFPYEKIK
ncbi:MAG: transcription termination factor Rho, partial [Bacteroidia bacterium]